jgi:uncharacterized membrane protein YoaT (DUF817 family)
MPDRVKFVLNATLALATLFLTSVLWHYPVALIAVLLVTALGIYVIRPSATSVVVYMTGFVFGPIAEAVSISTGAWEYDTTHLLGVPVWLPFVWGNAALFIQNMAELWRSLLMPESARRRVVGRSSLGDSPEAPIPAGDGNGTSTRSREAESTARR